MLSSLKAEMARANVTIAEIAEFSGKSHRTIRDRIKGKGQFPIQDSIKVKNAFFPGMDLEYPFARTEAHKAPPYGGAGKGSINFKPGRLSKAGQPLVRFVYSAQK